MSKTETEKLAGTVNGFVILARIVLVGGCIFGPCAVPFILSGAQ
jgi:hypothetical protein